MGIPSRLVYGDVRNHLASPRLTELIGGNVFTYHALTLVHLDGRWVKATPVFSKLLCKLYKIAPLEFDGRSDSLANERRRASTLATCMPKRSHSPGGTTTTDHATARRSTCS